MIEVVGEGPSAGGQGRMRTYFCNICSHEWTVALEPVDASYRSSSWRSAPALRRDELATLADIGALNAFTHDRRSALWQVERAVRPAGELFQEGEHDRAEQPLAPMNPDERLQADYAGMGLTIGPAPDGAAPLDAGAARRCARPTCRRPATAGACAWPAW